MFAARLLCLLAFLPQIGLSAEGRIVIAGDSTASDYPSERAPQAGWGQALPFYYEKVDVLNLAVSGRSTKSYIDEGLWAELLNGLESGDRVLISFGHNDSRDDDPSRYTDPEGAYRENLLRFVAEIRDHGATPIIVTSAARRLWEGPAMVETHGLYRKNAMLAAQQADAKLIDLSFRSLSYFEAMGREETKSDFLWLTEETANARFPEGVEDNTHFTELGACGVAYILWADLEGEASTVPEDGTRPEPVLDCNRWLKRSRHEQ